MKLYKIRNWNDLFENNRTRELKRLDWLPIPNKQDGDGYTLVMDNEDGPAIFGAWIAIAQIASRCKPRGVLMRDGNKPHDPHSLARMSRVPAGIIQRMFDVVSHPDVNWLEISLLEDGCEIPAPSCDFPASGCLEGKGREGKEGKGNSPTLACALQWLHDARDNGADYTEPEVRSAYLGLQERGWMRGNKVVLDYRAALERQIGFDRQRRDEDKARIEARLKKPAQKMNVI